MTSKRDENKVHAGEKRLRHRSCQRTLHRKSFTKWIAKFRSKGPVLSVDASPQMFYKMNCKVSQQRSGLVSGCFTAKVSQNELQSFAAKVRSCQWTLHRNSFTKWIAKFRSKGPVLSVDASPQKFHKMNCKVSQQRSGLQSVDASPQKFHKMNCKVSQQRSGLVSGCFTAKVSQNKLQSFAAKVRSCQWTLHRNSFTKWIAKFRSKGPVLSVDASPQKFHKMNCKVSQQRSGLVSGRFTAIVSQNELQSFAAKVRSCQWMLHRKSFTKGIAKLRSKGPVLSVDFFFNCKTRIRYITYITVRSNHYLHYITLHYITLHYITLHYITLHYKAYTRALVIVLHLHYSTYNKYSILIALNRYDNNTFLTHTNHADAQLISLQD